MPKRKLKDTDKDGVPDKFDCEPKNPKKHGVLGTFFVGLTSNLVGYEVSKRAAKKQRIEKLRKKQLENKRKKYWK